MKSPSTQAYARGVQAAAAFAAQLNRCRHPQAEPVILSTGELVACVCIGCYQQLPADYIEGQAERAHREAYWPDSEREAARRRWLALHSPNELRMDAGYPEL